MVATTGALVVFETWKETMFPVPLAASPIEVVELTQL